MADTDKRELTRDDLNRIDPSLADEVKTDDEIWNEIVTHESETGAARDSTDEPAPPATDNPPDDDDDHAQASDDKGADNDDVADKSSATADDDDMPRARVLESMTPEQKKFFESELHKYQSMAGRVPALMRRIDSLEQLVSGGTGGADEDAIAARRQARADRLRKLEEASSEIPELDPVRQEIEELSNDLASREDAELRRQRQIEESRLEQMAFERERMDSMAPDWLRFMTDNQAKFNEWVGNEAPKRIHDAAERNRRFIVNADEAFAVYEAFRAHLGAASPREPAPEPEKQQPQKRQLDERRERQLAGSASPRHRGAGPVVSGIPEEGDAETIWRQISEEERRRAAREAQY